MSYGIVTPITIDDFLDRCEAKHLPDMQNDILALAKAVHADVNMREISLYAKFSVINAVKLAGSVPTAELTTNN